MSKSYKKVLLWTGMLRMVGPLAHARPDISNWQAWSMRTLSIGTKHDLNEVWDFWPEHS